MIRKITADLAAGLCWRLLYLLRNKKYVKMTREEIRAMNISFSEMGEDLVVLSYFINRKNLPRGIYVDVGAYDPVRLSTTLLLHKMGWTGINIDPNPKKIELFNLHRPNCYNVRAAVSDRRKNAYYIEYPLEATNRISDTYHGNERSLCDEYPLKAEIIETCTLTDILEKSPFIDATIDYLNIDCEGHDYEVLIGLDIEKYRPFIISIESFNQHNTERINKYLNEKSYKCDAKIRHTYLYVNQSS